MRVHSYEINNGIAYTFKLVSLLYNNSLTGYYFARNTQSSGRFCVVGCVSNLHSLIFSKLVMGRPPTLHV